MKKYIINSLGHISEIDNKPLTAYKLADKAEAMKTGEYGYVDGWIEEAAYMLRQQADRIAELENKLKRCEPICKPSACDCIKPKELSDEEISLLKAEIEAHKKTNQLLAQKIVELEEGYKR